MERAGPRRRTFDGVRARRVWPGLARAALWIALVCACVPFLPELLARGSMASGSVIVTATRDAVAYWLAGAFACVLAAWIARRGVTEPVTVRLDSRCVYVATKRLERRTPRWMIEEAVVSRAERREVQLPLTSGRTVQLLFANAEQARRFVDALGEAPHRLHSRGRAT